MIARPAPRAGELFRDAGFPDHGDGAVGGYQDGSGRVAEQLLHRRGRLGRAHVGGHDERSARAAGAHRVERSSYRRRRGADRPGDVDRHDVVQVEHGGDGGGRVLLCVRSGRCGEVDRVDLRRVTAAHALQRGLDAQRQRILVARRGGPLARQRGGIPRARQHPSIETPNRNRDAPARDPGHRPPPTSSRSEGPDPTTRRTRRPSKGLRSGDLPALRGPRARPWFGAWFRVRSRHHHTEGPERLRARLSRLVLIAGGRDGGRRGGGDRDLRRPVHALP